MDDPYVALERELSRLFRRAHGASTEISAVAHPDLDAELYTLLAFVDRHPGSLAKNLAAEFRLDPGTVSRQLSRSETAGLIRRSPDPHDSRGMAIELTTLGREMLVAAQSARTTLVRASLHEWPRDDVSTLATLLQRLIDLDLDGGRITDVADSMMSARIPPEHSAGPTGDQETPGS
ncbi:MarR family winged helix-turn-helix transcriptional regulator [Sanguibacter sp. 25GB23B1]|uniref:MarR family winged helix-turn-helix transcriptional regulator n=1 Tax=unclassified Sanguibacter TaxID=2645534 RepID=UPI0032AF22AC